ncbi:hypothetical protein BKA62DRAFT_720689 [Auriculariales sp. MPI-PUGE-AT-0066]|nr:hypothetical protein BKA62DRAFT_720689 [Auriculariales sp. MPI-PUGE-AT-0066]
MPALIPALVAGMILSGSCNSLFYKYQDMQCVENCEHPDPSKHILFEQPVWQSFNMFLGEMLCFLPVLYIHFFAKPSTEHNLPKSDDNRIPLQGWRILWLWLPAASDLTATTLMNVGLLYTPVSIYQMTRGSLVLFVGGLSVIFLHRRLWLYQWLSLLVVVTGVAIVGLSGSLVKQVQEHGLLNLLAEDDESVRVVVGVFFIAFAQIFTAIQFVVEEKIVSHYAAEPLIMVGFEGFFGALTIVLAAPVLYAMRDRSPMFDLPRGWHQMTGNSTVLLAGLAIATSIACFNFCGLSVTRNISATARSVIDNIRTLCIWLVSLALGWEHFVVPLSFLQVLGFALVVYGTSTFNDLVKPPTFLRPTIRDADNEALPRATADERTRLLAEDSLDETSRLPADLGTTGYDVLPPPQQGQQQRGS